MKKLILALVMFLLFATSFESEFAPRVEGPIIELENGTVLIFGDIQGGSMSGAYGIRVPANKTVVVIGNIYGG